jgi:hypothetical protein
MRKITEPVKFSRLSIRRLQSTVCCGALVFSTIRSNTMRNRKIALAAVAIAALAPTVSNASPERAALKACAGAFASSLASSGGAGPAFKIDYRDLSTGSMLEFYVRTFTFELHANDSKTGLPIARASCSADAHGAVIALSSMPLETEHPALAAKL